MELTCRAFEKENSKTMQVVGFLRNKIKNLQSGRPKHDGEIRQTHLPYRHGFIKHFKDLKGLK